MIDSTSNRRPPIPLHISESRIEQWTHTLLCRFYTCEQSQALEDHLGLDLSAVSILRGGPARNMLFFLGSMSDT